MRREEDFLGETVEDLAVYSDRGRPSDLHDEPTGPQQLHLSSKPLQHAQNLIFTVVFRCVIQLSFIGTSRAKKGSFSFFPATNNLYGEVLDSEKLRFASCAYIKNRR